jgi:hypothetical protein
MPGVAPVQGANSTLTTQGVQELKENNPDLVERLGQRGTLVDIASEHLGLGGEDTDYLNAFPPAVLEAVRAAIYEAIQNDQAVHMLFKPAYDFGAEIFDVGEAIGIQLSGPYPGQRGFPRSTYVKRA